MFGHSDCRRYSVSDLCFDCPRRCGASRSPENHAGFCNSPSLPRVARAAPHFGEEPCISGSHGAGTIFFTGCNLRCVFCQNREISRGQGTGRTLNAAQLRDLMLRLRDTGVHNIDLVTPSHYTRVIVQALDGLELGIPVVWNSSGYESVETLRMLEGLVQVYLPDLKYLNPDTARRFSAAPDYPQVAVLALKEMFRQRGPYRMNEDGLLISGLLVRHLILPGHAEESMDIIDFIADTYPRGSVLFSLMSQYTPMSVFSSAPELCRAVTEEENRNLLHYLSVRRVTAGYWQDTTSSGTAEIPAFDGTGLDF